MQTMYIYIYIIVFDNEEVNKSYNDRENKFPFVSNAAL